MLVNESEATVRTAPDSPTTQDQISRLPLSKEAARRREPTGAATLLLLRKGANKYADFRHALSSLKRSLLTAHGCLLCISSQTHTTQEVISDLQHAQSRPAGRRVGVAPAPFYPSSSASRFEQLQQTSPSGHLCNALAN